MITHRFTITLKKSAEDVLQALTDDPYLKQFDSSVKVTNSEIEGRHELAITIPPEGQGGTFGTSVSMFVQGYINEGILFGNQYGD